MFGPECSGHVPVRLLGLCEDSASTMGWGSSVDRMVPVGMLTDMGLPPALGSVECKSPVRFVCAICSEYMQQYVCDLFFECVHPTACNRKLQRQAAAMPSWQSLLFPSLFWLQSSCCIVASFARDSAWRRQAQRHAAPHLQRELSISPMIAAAE